MSAEKVEMHVYGDGIQEEDNQLPNWWLFTLFGAMVFSFGYWFVYHTQKLMPNPPAIYAQDVKEYQIQHPPPENSDQAILAVLKDPAALEEGKKTFVSTCAACHGPYGQGIVGPNLTDNYWLHGGKPAQIAKTVTDGYPEKGMPAWGKPLGPDKVKNVAAYVSTLRGTTLPEGVKPKDPQGELEE